MKDRILEFLRTENKSSAQFAEEIGVQPSGISHILSGRNNPSLDFVLKMLEKYQFLSTEWLLFGKGSMYKDQRMRSLFDEPAIVTMPEPGKKKDNETADKSNPDPVKSDPSTVLDIQTNVDRIVWFYRDGSFREYLPKQ